MVSASLSLDMLMFVLSLSLSFPSLFPLRLSRFLFSFVFSRSYRMGDAWFSPFDFRSLGFSYIFRGRRQLPQAGEVRRPRRARGVVDVVG